MAALGCLISLALGGPAFGSFTQEDQLLANFLIRELRYYDTAGRFLDTLDKDPRLAPTEKAEVAALRIDLLQAQGKREEAEKALAEFKRKFPTHQRASLGTLDLVKASLAEALGTLDKASAESNAARRETLSQRAAQLLATDVEARLEAMAQDGANTAKSAKPDSEEYEIAIRTRDQAELTRVQALMAYARKLRADDPGRKPLLERGQKLADQFVEERFEFPVMQYEGQLQRGLYAYELGQYALAEEHLSILYTILPLSAPPYPKPIVTAFKTLRVQAVLFGARAATAAGNAKAAVAAIREHFAAAAKNPLNLSSTDTSPEFRQLGVLLALEYATALVASGQVSSGLDEIQKVIARYREDPSPEGQAFLIDARKTLGRIATLTGVSLRAADYVEAAIGLKSELRLDDALEMYKTALSSLRAEDRKEMSELVPVCLNEIAELHYRLERYAEAALAYDELTTYFSPSLSEELGGKVAQNFLGAITKAIDSAGATGHAGLKKIYERASQLYDRKGQGLGSLQAAMSTAGNLEGEGKLEAARARYLEVPETYKGQRVPFYWRAQASAWRCVVSQWEAADAAAREALAPELEKAQAELSRIYTSAIDAGDKPGAATAALTLGQVHYGARRWEEAAQALRPFANELADESYLRCAGLGYLAIVLARQNACDEGKSVFLQLSKDCKGESAVAYAAQALADAFEARGDARTAAVMALVYARDAAAREDLGKLDFVVNLSRRLMDGGLGKYAKPYIDRARKLGKAGDPEVARLLLVLELKDKQASKAWDAVIEKGQEYVRAYKAQGSYYDDPYVHLWIAQAYLARGGKSPSTSDLQEADRSFSAAAALLGQRRDPKGENVKAESEFWDALYKFLSNKLTLGSKGEGDAYKDVVAFTDEYAHTEFGGRKEEFLKLKDAAEKRAGGRR